MIIEFENIIVAVDLSDFSETVVEQAKKISNLLKKPIKYVFVEEKKEMPAGSLEGVILKKYNIQDSNDLSILFGDPAKSILEYSRTLSSPLIVAGYRGGHAVAELFLGSVAKELALFTKCPLWIHRSLKCLLPKKIMVPLEFNQHAEPLLIAGQKLGRLFSAEVEVFHSMKLPSASVDSNSYGVIYEAFKEMDEKAVIKFKEEHPGIKVVAVDGEPGFEIKEHARFFDLLVLAPSYHGSKVPFFGTTTTQLMSSGETSILVIPGVNRS